MAVIVNIIKVEEKNVIDMNEIMVENLKEKGVDMKVQRGHLVCCDSSFLIIFSFYLLSEEVQKLDIMHLFQ